MGRSIFLPWICLYVLELVHLIIEYYVIDYLNMNAKCHIYPCIKSEEVNFKY